MSRLPKSRSYQNFASGTDDLASAPSRFDPGHLSAAELAELKLPGLPATKRGVQLLAAREGWPFEAAPARGGEVRRYAVTNLPVAARRTLEQRRKAFAPANARPVGRPKGSDFFTRHPDVADAVEAILAERALASSRVMELLAQRFAVLPSPRSLRRFIAQLESEKRALLASLRDPDAYKSRFKLALGRADGALTHANQRWEIDTTKADVMTQGGRVAVLGLIDVWSRRARFLVVPSESAQSVRRLLVTTIAAWGVMPEEVGTDNGSGFVNQSLATALPVLGIRQWRAAPGSPEKKPYVERLFGTFTRERAELLDGFAGHNVAEAQALRAKAKKETGRAVIVPQLTGEQLQAILDAWTDGVYNQREHGTTRQAPLLRWLGSKVPSAAAPSADILRIALSRLEGPATVGKRGVQWKGGRYWSEALTPWVGRQVVLRRDEDDLGALFVFDSEGHFIDTAVNHERAGLSEAAFSQAAARQQAEWMKRSRAELREKQRRFSFDDVRDQLLRDDAEKAGRLAVLPVATVERSTPQLDALRTQPAPPLPSQASIDEAVRRTSTRRRREPTVAERVAETDRLIAAADAGAAVDPQQLKLARLYAGSTAYRAHKIVSGDFGAGPASAPDLRRQAS
jgi:putative transposase